MPRTSLGTLGVARRISSCALLASLILAPPAGATPSQYLTVGDPLEEEMRVLDLFPRGELRDRLRLPHTGSRPLQLFELQGTAAPVVDAKPAVALSLSRIERVLGRDPSPSFAPSRVDHVTPRLYQRSEPGGQVVEASAGLEGTLLTDKLDAGSAVVSGSGVHARFALGFDRWLLYAHPVLGRFADGQQIADPVIANTDIIILTEETYLSVGGGSGRWAVSFGRNRWHWGPGEEGSLLLSRTSAPFTGLTMRGSLESFHLTGTVVDATLQQTAGEQLAAHRLEWQPVDPLRVGISEAVRYRSSGWQWAYAAGVFPYAIAQRLLAQDEPDSTEALHNNILVSFDAAWRVAPGMRVFGELLVDDLHSKTTANPDKIAWQVGWEGANMMRDRRLTWGAEYTRVWRYVYTSYFGRSYVAQGGPLGFPTGPDSRRVSVRLAWDPSVDWQATARLTQTDQGENSLAEPYYPGTPRPDGSTFEGVVEHARAVELGIRWWPAGGIDIGIRGAYSRIHNHDHLPGAGSDDWLGALDVRLVR